MYHTILLKYENSKPFRKNIPLPHTLKSLHFFLRKKIRRFILNDSEVAKTIQSILNKDVSFLWKEDRKKDFSGNQGCYFQSSCFS